MPKFDLSKYDTVDSRITQFWEAYPDGCIATMLQTSISSFDQCVYMAAVYKKASDEFPAATGFAAEERGKDFKDGANVTSWHENCETSAIGRALANMGFKASKDSPRPSREEMARVAQREGAGTQRGEEPQQDRAYYSGEIKTRMAHYKLEKFSDFRAYFKEQLGELATKPAGDLTVDDLREICQITRPQENNKNETSVSAPV